MVRATPRQARAIPPLRNGDRLTRPEFERRYDAMPELKKAELIDGIVYIPSPDFYLPGGNPPEMPSPVSYSQHARALHVWVRHNPHDWNQPRMSSPCTDFSARSIAA